MESENFLLTIALIAVVISAFGLGFTYTTLDNFRENWLTGFVTSTGTVNVTVATSAAINFTTNNINWGSGTISNNSLFSILDTSAGSVTNGTWTPVSNGFIIENYGNVNVTLELKTSNDAAGFIGGTSPGYKFNITNSEADSCTAGGVTLGEWVDVNTTSPGTLVCNPLNFLDSLDTVKVDIQLTIPYDSLKDTLSSTMTATATAI